MKGKGLNRDTVVGQAVAALSRRDAAHDTPTDVLGDWVHGLRPETRVGCDDPDHDRWWQELQTLRAEYDCLAAENKAVTAERDAAQAQLARHLATPTALPTLNVTWDEPIPEGAAGMLACFDEPVSEATRRELTDWPDVAGDKVETPERIETGGQD